MGCSTVALEQSGRRFDFPKDTFSYPNELVWTYHFDPTTDERSVARQEPPPDYTHHCFVVARSSKQFFLHARFDAERPKLSAEEYRSLISKVMRRSPRRACVESEKVVFPGYTSLREFSRAWEPLLKETCGGAWQSYFQRGHWRMLFPFSRRHQEMVAEQLSDVEVPEVLHLVRFPQLSINHAVVLFEAEKDAGEIRYSVYDPNHPAEPSTLIFNRQKRTFYFGRNNYFAGGRVDVYPIYRGWRY